MSDDLAFITLLTDDEMRAQGYGQRPHPYDFGFIPGMARLRSAHKRGGRVGRPRLQLLNAVSRRVSACRARRSRVGRGDQTQGVA
jgi:hypothetical protein